VVIHQPRKGGQRASADAVMLAAAVQAKSGQRVLELGCGSGVVMLCLAARVKGLEIEGIELDPALAELAKRNIEDNGMADALHVHPGDIRRRGQKPQPNSFDHVCANPPYFEPGRHRIAKDAARALARQGVSASGADAMLADWVAAMLRFAKPGGRLTLIQRAERLPELLAALLPAEKPKAGSVEIIPLWSKPGRPAERLILRAVKGGRAPLIFRPGLMLHDAAGAYLPEAEAMLRQGAAFPG